MHTSSILRSMTLFYLPFLLALGMGCATAKITKPDLPTRNLDASSPPSALSILFVHGYFGFAELPLWGDYIPGARHALAEQEQQLFFTDVPVFVTPQTRAPFLVKRIKEVLEETGASQLHIIAHSMGGLDARVALADPNVAKLVFSLTTISSPHHGLDVPAFAKEIPEPIYAFFAMPLALGLDWIRGLPATSTQIQETLQLMSKDRMTAFNKKHPAPNDVFIFTIAGLTWASNSPQCAGPWGRPTVIDAPMLALLPSFLVIRGSAPFEANDGVIPVWSARFAHFLGCLPADHSDELNQSVEILAAPQTQPFDALHFYRTLGARLRLLEQSGNAAVMDIPFYKK
ncbi:MAG: hypothetical protein GY822_03135 [Deltaproteobacteria bacterium]|nr:hypothetical protein [Deltaproteobacteria bacterium]